MPTIAGASQYLNAATLANQQGLPPSTNSLLGQAGGSTVSLLDAGRTNTGVGLSANARALTKSFISDSGLNFGKIFSLNGVEFGTSETLQQKILAIRAGIPESGLAPSLRGENVDEEA